MQNKRGRPSRIDSILDGMSEDAQDNNYRLRKHRFRVRIGTSEYHTYWFYDPSADGGGSIMEYEEAKESYKRMFVSYILGSQKEDESQEEEVK